MSRQGRRNRRGKIHHVDSSSDDDFIYEETEPPMPKSLPKAAEFNKEKDHLYARIDYRMERSDYYLKQWRDGTLNIEDLSMNTEQGINFSKPK